MEEIRVVSRVVNSVNHLVKSFQETDQSLDRLHQTMKDIKELKDAIGKTETDTALPNRLLEQADLRLTELIRRVQNRIDYLEGNLSDSGRLSTRSEDIL